MNSPGSWSEFLERRADGPTGDASGRAAPMPPFTEPDAPAGGTTDRGQPPVFTPRPHAAIGRFLVSLAGLLAAGLVVLGVTLVVLMIVVPRVRTGTAINASTGPGWDRSFWHLAVGSASEVALVFTRRRRWPIRVTTAGLVTLSGLVVLTSAWWM